MTPNHDAPLPPGDSQSDVLLVAQVGRGSREALEEIYDRHSPSVYGLALRLLGQPCEAEVIVSEVFWTLWRKPGNFDSSRSTLRTYLLVMTRSRAIDRMRREAVHDRKLRESATSHPTPAAAGPHEAAASSERGQAVRDAMANLSDDQQKVLSLAYYEGKTQEEIAEQLQMPLGTVKTRVRIGLKKLRAALRRLGGGDDV